MILCRVLSFCERMWVVGFASNFRKRYGSYALQVVVSPEMLCTYDAVKHAFLRCVSNRSTSSARRLSSESSYDF